MSIFPNFSSISTKRLICKDSLNCMDSFAIKPELEKKLNEFGLSYQGRTDNSYLLCTTNGEDQKIIIKLICSDQVDESALGSRNSNLLQAIGNFKFRLPIEVNEPDIYIFAFYNSETHSIEYVIIPSKDIRRRLAKESQIAARDKDIEIVFWLMLDNRLYETKSKGIEWEWYFLSKGNNGRLADRTDFDYTEFLNDWNRLKMK